MLRMLCAGMIAAGLLCPATVRLRGQAPSISAEVKAELAKSVVPPPSNQVVGIDIDQFIGRPLASPVRAVHVSFLCGRFSPVAIPKGHPVQVLYFSTARNWRWRA